MLLNISILLFLFWFELLIIFRILEINREKEFRIELDKLRSDAEQRKVKMNETYKKDAEYFDELLMKTKETHRNFEKTFSEMDETRQKLKDRVKEMKENDSKMNVLEAKLEEIIEEDKVSNIFVMDLRKSIVDNFFNIGVEHIQKLVEDDNYPSEINSIETEFYGKVKYKSGLEIKSDIFRLKATNYENINLSGRMRTLEEPSEKKSHPAVFISSLFEPPKKKSFKEVLVSSLISFNLSKLS